MNRLTFSVLLAGLLPLCPTARAADKPHENTAQKLMDEMKAKSSAGKTMSLAKKDTEQPAVVSPAKAPVGDSGKDIKASAEPKGEPKSEAAPAAAGTADKAQNAADAAADPLACVEPIKDVIRFYEGEARIVKVMMEGWNTRIAANIKRGDELQAKLDGQKQKVQELLAEKTKPARREAAEIKREMSQTKKDIAALKRELKMQCRQLSDEMKMRARDSQNSLRDTYQLVQSEVTQRGAELTK